MLEIWVTKCVYSGTHQHSQPGPQQLGNQAIRHFEKTRQGKKLELAYPYYFHLISACNQRYSLNFSMYWTVMKLLLVLTLLGNFSSDFLSCSSCFIFKSLMTRSSSWERVIVLSPTFSLSPSSSLLLFSSPPFRLMSSKSRPKNASYKHTVLTEWPFMLYIQDCSKMWSDLNLYLTQQD